MIYFDNNGTTIMPPIVKNELINWINRGNPSADYKSAQNSRQVMDNFRSEIARYCGFKLGRLNITCEEASNDEYEVVFTSCASESNNYLIRSVVDSFNRYRGIKDGITAHLIVAGIEHKSIIECCNNLNKLYLAEITYVAPDNRGFINKDDLEKEIRPGQTTLIVCMHGNNETGVINNIAAIGKMAHKNGIPFFSDCVQTFGKMPINPIKYNLDAFSASFHKFYGPLGGGLLVIKNKFLYGFKLCSHISGAQNKGLRGGTENIPAIAAGFMAFRLSKEKRDSKNKYLQNLKRYIVETLANNISCKSLSEYWSELALISRESDFNHGREIKKKIEIVFLSTPGPEYLPNTLLLSVVKRGGANMCNKKLKEELEKEKIIVSIGSACNTSSEKASHVLTAMKLPPEIKRGTIRVAI